MSLFYLDACAWVKRCFKEPGTDRVIDLFRGQHRLLCTGLGYGEVSAAMSRQQPARRFTENKLRALQEQLGRDWNEMSEFPMSSQLFQRAILVTHKFKLRGPDAIHLTAALELQDLSSGTREILPLLASDRELLDAAAGAGLRVEDPANSTLH